MGFLIADLAGYTALTEAMGDMEAAKVIARYVELAHDVLRPGTRIVERCARAFSERPHLYVGEAGGR